jgi:hypothetical protein
LAQLGQLVLLVRLELPQRCLAQQAQQAQLGQLEHRVFKVFKVLLEQLALLAQLVLLELKVLLAIAQLITITLPRRPLQAETHQARILLGITLLKQALPLFR